MATTDTKEHLIKVARKLFAQQGIGNITMNDIAKAANKSRRTVYTYFQSKEELLEASIEMEVMKISNAMTKVAISTLSPDRKIIKLIFVRLELTRSIVRRNSCLHSDYIVIVEHIRKSFDAKEIALFRHIISEGKQKGIFNTESPDLAARFLHFCLKGIEIPFINGMVSKNNDDKFVNNFTEKVILNALGYTKPINSNNNERTIRG
ncbi:MAG: TetR/AcrR family transcriptional regulator [Bacteroidaceae bacterium]|nr:TetR/AcrR family transcriptional regulator [Bacteroidaceae bacterium]